MAYNPIMRYFEWGHLKGDPQREVAQRISDLAKWMDQNVPDGPEKSAGLRKLLEGKDCLVRATLD